MFISKVLAGSRGYKGMSEIPAVRPGYVLPVPPTYVPFLSCFFGAEHF